jgi:hypothetical protein
MPATLSDAAISYSLTKQQSDMLTFTHTSGQKIPVRVLPRTRSDGKLTLYETWTRDTPSRFRRLLTERGYEIVFELPLLFEYSLEHEEYPTQPNELIRRFFEAMEGKSFKFYPRELFR